jgi:hypothetical protein
MPPTVGTHLLTVAFLSIATCAVCPTERFGGD